MVTHIVIFCWTAGVTNDKIKRFMTALDELADELRNFVSIQHGPDQRFRAGNGDYALVATFSAKDDWDAYQAHPKHKEFVRDFVAPIQASRLTVQFEHDNQTKVA